MRSISSEITQAENAPEGIHEDGANYIISALVINRENIKGGTSQIHENTKVGLQLIHEETLAPGQFIFQADTGEEILFDCDLWHYVTPIQAIQKTHKGYRDIIGLDIELL